MSLAPLLVILKSLSVSLDGMGKIEIGLEISELGGDSMLVLVGLRI
jgi:hypothetical protein